MPLWLRLGDSALTIPALTAACRKRIDGNETLTARIEERKKAIGEKHARQWQKWQDQVKEQWNERPMTESRLAHEVWQVIKDEDWVLTANTLKEWVHKVWDFDKPLGGLTPEQIRDARIILWKGFCSVHQMFQPEQIDRFKASPKE